MWKGRRHPTQDPSTDLRRVVHVDALSRSTSSTYSISEATEASVRTRTRRPVAITTEPCAAEWNSLRSSGAPETALAGQPCESEQQHAIILVRNEGQSQLDQGHMR